MSHLCTGDYVRPNSPLLGLPRNSIWRVRPNSSAFDLRIEPVIDTSAQTISPLKWKPNRYSASDFDKVVLFRGRWVDAREAVSLRGPASFRDDVLTGRMSSVFPSPQNLPKTLFSSADAVATAFTAMEQASNATAAIDNLLEAARKLEAERKQALREAQAAKAKADKEAAARAKVEEARKALAAKLHADQELAVATRHLIVEVGRLLNGGSEQLASSDITKHADQLDALAKSYGYKIVRTGAKSVVAKA